MTDDVPAELTVALERARPVLLDECRAAGVIAIRYAVGYVHPFAVSTWLCTTTDAERDALPRYPFLDLIRSTLIDLGAPAADIGRQVSVAESQETVDRDYQGSWFYAMH